jgi:ribosome-associated toxin RatA of RatAB toxin-antitoxin module
VTSNAPAKFKESGKRWLHTSAFLLLLGGVALNPASVSAFSSGISASRSGWTASKKQHASLRTGKVLVETVPVAGSDYPLFRGYGYVDATPQEVWSVVEDCANYDKNLARIASSRLVSRAGSKVRCETVVNFPAPFKNARVLTESVHEELSGSRFMRTWQMVSGDFDINKGKWTILPFDESGKASLVVYETHADPQAPIPAAIVKLAQRRALPNLFEKLRQSV